MKVQKFIELTHEKYYADLSEYFGDTIIAFFTDKPKSLDEIPCQYSMKGDVMI